jgi:Lrp/AsnC family transcriptional regulator, leucine-responsive regulatory protein
MKMVSAICFQDESMDKKDRAIVDLLKMNSRMSWQEIGKKVFLSGQAVGLRVQNLLDSGMIERFTLVEHCPSEQFITIYMNNSRFAELEQLVGTFAAVQAIYKITGDGCYFIHANFAAQELERFLQQVALYARYKVSHKLRRLL